MQSEVEVEILSRKQGMKSQMFLMEFIVVVLFFSICVTICFSGFVKANAISRDGKALNHAIILAQSAAECIKASDYANIDKNLDEFIYPQAEADDYTLEITKGVEQQMLRAEIRVCVKDKKICELQVKKYIPDEVR